MLNLLTFLTRGKRITLPPNGGLTEAMFHSNAGFSLLVFNSAGLSGALLSRKTSFQVPVDFFLFFHLKIDLKVSHMYLLSKNVLC